MQVRYLQAPDRDIQQVGIGDCSAEVWAGGRGESPVYKRKVMGVDERVQEGGVDEKRPVRLPGKGRGALKGRREVTKAVREREGRNFTKLKGKSRGRTEGMIKRGRRIKYGKFHFVWQPGVRRCLLSEELPVEPWRERSDFSGFGVHRRRGGRRRERQRQVFGRACL